MEKIINELHSYSYGILFSIIIVIIVSWLFNLLTGLLNKTNIINYKYKTRLSTKKCSYDCTIIFINFDKHYITEIDKKGTLIKIPNQFWVFGCEYNNTNKSYFFNKNNLTSLLKIKLLFFSLIYYLLNKLHKIFNAKYEQDLNFDIRSNNTYSKFIEMYIKPKFIEILHNEAN